VDLVALADEVAGLGIQSIEGDRDPELLVPPGDLGVVTLVQRERQEGGLDVDARVAVVGHGLLVAAPRLAEVLAHLPVLARGLEQLGPAVLALLQTPCLDLETSRFVGDGNHLLDRREQVEQLVLGHLPSLER
jgi:hypothetical protein